MFSLKKVHSPYFGFFFLEHLFIVTYAIFVFLNLGTVLIMVWEAALAVDLLCYFYWTRLLEVWHANVVE